MQVLAERAIPASLVKSPRGIRYEIREEHIPRLKEALKTAGLEYTGHTPTYIKAGILTIYVKNVRADEDEVAGTPVMVVEADTPLEGTKKTNAKKKANAFLNAVLALAPCPPGKERNPATNRCRTVKARKAKAKTLKNCPPDKIRNPTTNRCVKRTGAIGRTLV